MKKQYWEIPLYLQELLGEVSAGYVRTGGTKFDTLVNAITRSPFKSVLFLTLNYDLFLENSMRRILDVRFPSLADYCVTGRRWNLTKAHGSVNWGRPIVNTGFSATDFNDPLANLNEDPKFGDTTHLAGHKDSARMLNGVFHYPALAVPLEGQKESVCPVAHIAFAKEFLRDCIAFLFIGFSGLDQDVLNLLSAVDRVQSLMVVCEDRKGALTTYNRITSTNRNFQTFPAPEAGATFEKGFAAFVDNRELDRFLRS